ncbi:carboxymuconolactone decarboxylase family protein [Asanoa sp. NPDC049518]|uniref:carboxymuconolactone decarboxylase family protein n=1 Tax=unclassified Asanoa TaxID=2685164 RepID=UPI003421153D
MVDDGAAVRRAVLGDAHVDRAAAAATAFTAPWQEHVTAHAWGAVWTRPELDRRTRCLVTIALLAGQHATAELAMHVRAAIGQGVTPTEIREVLLHTAVYAGAPAANTAFATAQRVLDELGIELGIEEAS